MAGVSSRALTSLGACRAWVLRDETDGSKDSMLTTLINGVSREVIRYLDRELFPTDAATRLFTYDGGTYLSLAPYELRTLTTITVQPAGAATATTLDPAAPDLKLEPRNKTDEGTYLWVRMPQYGNPLAFPATSRIGLMSEVSITGDWGMAALPEDLEGAVLTIIDWRYRNPASARTVTVGPVTMESYSQSSADDVPQFPAEAMAVLDSIRRTDWGA